MRNSIANKYDDLMKYELFKNPSLLLDKYLFKQDDKNESKKELIKKVMGCDFTANDLYTKAFACRADIYQNNACASICCVEAASRVAVGLGSESVLETSLQFNKIYGAPILPGTALKGLTRHYCLTHLGGYKANEITNCAQQSDDVRAACLPSPADWREKEKRQKDLKFQTLKECGAVDDGGLTIFDRIFGLTENSGKVIFHDAWYIPTSANGKPFLRDVITVHHQDYYGGKDKPPADYDSPIPTSFVDVKPGACFLLALESRDADMRAAAMDILQRALEQDGIGAKTSSGYGRFKRTCKGC